jgi:PAS domain S-box-containing protein
MLTKRSTDLKSSIIKKPASAKDGSVPSKKKSGFKGSNKKTKSSEKSNSADKTKTKDQLIAELSKLRRKTARLEKANATYIKLDDKHMENEARLLSAPRVAGLGFWQWDIKTNILYWSDETYLIAGRKPGDFEPKYEDFLVLLHPEDRPTVLAAVDAAIQGRAEYGLDHRLVRADGDVFHVRSQGEVIRDDDGRPIHMVGTMMVISERKKFEIDLIEEKTKLGSMLAGIDVIRHITFLKTYGECLRFYGEIFQNMVEGVILTRTSDGVIVFANSTFEQMFGYGPGELTEKHVSVLNASLDKDAAEVASEIVMILREQGVWKGEVHNIRADGTTFWCHACVSTFNHFEYGNVWLTVQRDITERKHAQQMLKEAHDFLEIKVVERTAELVEANLQLQDEIAFRRRAEKEVVAHKMKLSAMTLELSLAEERERRNIVEDLHDHVAQSLAMTKLKMSEISSLATAEISTMLDELNDQLHRIIKDIRSLIFSISPPVLYELGFKEAVLWIAEQMQHKYGLSVEVEADEQLVKLDHDISVILFKAVRELLTNIVKHSGTDNATVSLHSNGDTFRVSVKDNGAGFDVSEIYFSNDSSLKFGIFNIMERIRCLGGSVDIRSLSGQGTQNTIEVPLTKP